ncbi:DNA repair protein RecN [Formosa algae]|uniref:DNA repair protein RecN n=1 Tax=Formosa algae TaxID=225843 RepID=A0A9X1CCG4_9FLAO|nr:DNA repair protein RecN [Formosa algae]MBP1840215.1 DNA repair protein RecN (Recombination protein N) [Formosa algae]MDQ0335815.1 DNA repair protein RecN (Recombination protein N) [Formosa algae]OEI80971.1 DNA repair protein RecN [Formosa algae]
MLTSLSIKNYALIDDLQADFNTGFTIITGETGAGKSILLGALSLILGKRADLSSLKDDSQKCIIEAVFDVSNYNLESIYNQEDLDFETQTIIRREILPSGKSRAFVNDSPVTLNSLQTLGERLIDIHSQHQTMQLTDDAFQFQVIDALAKVDDPLTEYKVNLKTYKSLQKELKKLQDFQAEANKEHEYNSFLLQELIDAKLVDGEFESLEEEYETLDNIEAIKEKIAASHQLLSDEQIGGLVILTEIKSNFSKIASFSQKYKELYDRIDSSLIELYDVFTEIEASEDALEADPNRLEVVNSRLQLLHNLKKKHLVSDISELIEIQNALDEKVGVTENLDKNIQKLKTEITKLEKVLNALAKTIHTNRNAVIPSLKSQLETLLSDLGMANAQFEITLQVASEFHANGKDNLQFLFSANKGGSFKALNKAASGGELSRIMLAIKSVLSKYMQLPTIMFDEIDTGVSGEISNKMGVIMKQMSESMQVFAITHLPQVAAKGDTHLKVYKEDVNQITTTNLVVIKGEDRVVEIAQMLGGLELSSSAIAHAKQLLN